MSAWDRAYGHAAGHAGLLLGGLLALKAKTTYAISPRYTVVSDDADARIGSFGWKSTSVTAPLCPGR